MGMDIGVQEYFASIPDDRRQLLEDLHRIVVGLYPEVEVSMKFKMPTYQVGEGWVAIANQKHYLSLYTCGYNHIARFKEKHPEIRTGKGCINFKPTINLPVSDISEVISHAIRNPKGE